jgi:exocyst complex protein 7
MAKFVF